MLRSYSAAVSFLLRSVMDRAALGVVALFNGGETAEDKVWSGQLFCMLTLSVKGEALHRLENVPEGEGAGCVEHCEPKRASRFLGMLRQLVLTYDFGDLGQVIGRVEQFKLMVSKYRDQSGEGRLTCCKQPFRLASKMRTRAITLFYTRGDWTPSRRWSCKPQPSHAQDLEDRTSFPCTSQPSKEKARKRMPRAMGKESKEKGKGKESKDGKGDEAHKNQH